MAAGANVKSGGGGSGGESGGVCVCARRSAGDDRARDSATAPRGETRPIVITRPLPLSPRAVRGVIGLEPNANTRVGWRESESRDRCCDASWCKSITGTGPVEELSASRSRSR